MVRCNRMKLCEKMRRQTEMWRLLTSALVAAGLSNEDAVVLSAPVLDPKCYDRKTERLILAICMSVDGLDHKRMRFRTEPD